MSAAAAVNSGDTSWVLFSTAAVLFMTPGLALFYAGMVSRRNTLVMLQQNIIPLGVISLTWVLVGYSLAFGNDAGNGIIADLRHVGLRDLGAAPPPALHVVNSDVAIPTLAFVAYQMMFAVITPALATGAVASRLRPLGWAVFLAVWSILVYPPIAHWLWAPAGWLTIARSPGLGRRHGGPRLGRRRRTRPARGARPAPRLARSRSVAALDPASSSSGPASCGSGGSGSTQATACRPTASPPRPWSTPRSPQRRPCWCGWSSSGSRTGTRPFSVG